MNELTYFLGGAVACFVLILVFVLIEFWITECGKGRIKKLVQEYDLKLDEQKKQNEEYTSKCLEEQKAANEEHTRKCLEEQKEQIETTERKAREYQSARFAEDREKIVKDGYDKGFKAGQKSAFDSLVEKIKAGELVVTRVK